MTTSEATAIKIPVHHGQAHQELSDTRCAFTGGRVGCNLIDIAKRTVGVMSEREHQLLLVETAKEVGDKACSTCLIPVWAAQEISLSGNGQ